MKSDPDLRQDETPLPLTGSCQCGEIRYEITRRPIATAVCHCLECQKFSASAFSITMLIDADAFRLLSGELKVYERPTDSGGVAACYFCPTCGNRVYHMNPEMPDVLRLKPGGLDDKSQIRPQVHGWVSRAQPWVHIPTDVPTYQYQHDFGACAGGRRS